MKSDSMQPMSHFQAGLKMSMLLPKVMPSSSTKSPMRWPFSALPP